MVCCQNFSWKNSSKAMHAFLRTKSEHCSTSKDTLPVGPQSCRRGWRLDGTYVPVDLASTRRALRSHEAPTSESRLSARLAAAWLATWLVGYLVRFVVCLAAGSSTRASPNTMWKKKKQNTIWAKPSVKQATQQNAS